MPQLPCDSVLYTLGLASPQDRAVLLTDYLRRIIRYLCELGIYSETLYEWLGIDNIRVRCEEDGM